MKKQITKEEFIRFLSKVDEEYKLFANINTHIGNMNVKVSIPVRLEIDMCNDSEITFIGAKDLTGAIIGDGQCFFILETWDLYIEFELEDFYGVSTMILIQDHNLCLKTDADLNAINKILNELYF